MSRKVLLLGDLHVDDVTSSINDTKVAINFYETSKDFLVSGKFDFYKWFLITKRLSTNVY